MVICYNSSGRAGTVWGLHKGLALDRFDNCHELWVHSWLHAGPGAYMVAGEGTGLGRMPGRKPFLALLGSGSRVTRSELGVGISDLEDLGELVHQAFLLKVFFGNTLFV